MTTIAAAARHGVVVMGADSQTNVYDRPIYGVRKLVPLHVAQADREGPHLLLGACGSGSLLGMLRRGLTIEGLPDAGDEDTWADAIAEAVMGLAADHHLLNDERDLDGSVLLGAVGRLWTISGLWAVPHADGLAAIGSGEGPAMGALDAELARDVPLDQAVGNAVRTAIRYDRHSGGDVVMAQVR